MILGSHNSWSYLPVKKWWMKPLAFTARCQKLNIVGQYLKGVRCFDLRIRFREGKLILAHGFIEYKITENELFEDLEYLNNSTEQVYIRIFHECRNKKQYTKYSLSGFIDFCDYCQERFPSLRFFCGRNLYNYEYNYQFPGPEPTCSETYSSVCPPKIIDDWWPWLFAKRNNKRIKAEGTDKDVLLIDFVNI